MPQQIIDLGATGSGAGGDSARTAFEKAIANFAELYIAALPGTAAQKQAARDMFGLGTAATRAVQTGPNDTTYGALMEVGAFGNGRHLDLRDTVFETGTPADVFGRGAVSGFARGGPDGLNIPVITSNNVFGVLSGFGHWTDGTGGAGAAWREFRTSGGRVYHQDQSYGAWGAWREVFSTGNILGTVSQSGGVPTGAIIERGSNANGEYVRFADGTQICRLDTGFTGGSVVSYLDWTFPATFSTAPFVDAQAELGLGTDPTLFGRSLTYQHRQQYYARIQYKSPSTVTVALVAIGRWN